MSSHRPDPSRPPTGAELLLDGLTVVLLGLLGALIVTGCLWYAAAAT